ncbi:MAG: hypothetical protein ACTSYO_04810, partial [Candidatus Ranarchaeia archaeon]
MKNISKILCVVSVFSVCVMIVFNHANSNELPAKHQQQSNHEYVISPDDPILTYKVEVGDKMLAGWRRDGSKIFPEEFLREKTDAGEREIKKAKKAQEYNEWRKSVTDKLWYEVVLQSIESGSLENKDIAKELCGFMRSAWAGNGEQYKVLSYDAFVTR